MSSRFPSALSRLVREPLIVFLAIGLLVFAAERVLRGGGEPISHVIDIDERQLQWIRSLWSTQASRAPTAAELEALVEDYVREEVLYREALRLGLDQGDVIIRRRLAQKMTFLMDDTAVVQAPSEDDLRRYFESNLETYIEPERLTFFHVYFSVDQRGPSAEQDARAVLEQLRRLEAPRAGDAVDTERSWRRLGDPFMLRREYADRTLTEIVELFGREYAEAIRSHPEGAWHGPDRSAYGFHLTRIVSRSPARQPQLDEVKARVAEDLTTARRQAANDRAYDEIRERYRVTIDESAMSSPPDLAQNEPQ